MQKRGLAFTALTALVLSGCASMSEQECLVADWRTVGFEDGVRGASASSIGRYRKDCADHGVMPDLQAYNAGRREGLRQYCTAENGFYEGSRGVQYSGVCPVEYEDAFVSGYRAGKHLHELETAASRIAQQIRQRENRLEAVKTGLIAKESALVSDETASEQRLVLLSEIRDLAEERGQLQSEIVDLERDLAVREADLADYRARVAYDY